MIKNKKGVKKNEFLNAFNSATYNAMFSTLFECQIKKHILVYNLVNALKPLI